MTQQLRGAQDLTLLIKLPNQRLTQLPNQDCRHGAHGCWTRWTPGQTEKALPAATVRKQTCTPEKPHTRQRLGIHIYSRNTSTYCISQYISHPTQYVTRNHCPSPWKNKRVDRVVTVLSSMLVSGPNLTTMRGKTKSLQKPPLGSSRHLAVANSTQDPELSHTPAPWECSENPRQTLSDGK